jgi:hypothetical protein
VITLSLDTDIVSALKEIPPGARSRYVSRLIREEFLKSKVDGIEEIPAGDITPEWARKRGV